MAPLHHCSLSTTFPPSPCPLIVLLTLCASPLPLAHARRVERVLAVAVEGSSARRRRGARHAIASGMEEETAAARILAASEPQASDSKGSALCPPTGAAPTMASVLLKTERFTRTTSRTSPSFTPLIPGLIASGIGITLVPQRPWVPYVPFREPSTTVQPYFEGPIESNVTGRVGFTSYLDCKIEMQQELAVTWLHRKEDSIQLLTVGRHSYSSDSRFSLSHKDPNNWRLQILPVMKNDEGLYECQIATHPIKVRKVFLQVTAPELKIVDEDCNELLERHYKAGSKVKLTCLATQLEEEDGLGEAEGASEADGWRGRESLGGKGGDDPAFNSTPPHRDGVVSRVLWSHGDSTISRNTTEKTLRPKSSPDGRNVSVALTFHAIKPEDGGNYTCSLGVVSSAAVHIKILNGSSNEGNEDNHTKNSSVPLRIIDMWMLSKFIFFSFTCLTYHHSVTHFILSS